MHIEKLRYFVDLYECRNFTETAKKNYISQASMSQYITSLEKEFETRFFDRTVTPIQPTAAGKVFYNNAKLLLKQFDETKEQIRHSSETQIPCLHLAYTSLSDLKLVMPFVSFLREEKYPITIELEKVACKDIESFVQKGLVDIGLSFSDEFTSEKLSQVLVKSGHYQALVAKGHPLFESSLIKVEDLYRHPLLMLSEDSMGESFLTMKERSLKDGYFPNIARTVDDFEEGFFYILSEQLIGFGTEDYHLSKLNGLIRNVPIEGSQHAYDIVLAFDKTTENKAVEEFIQAFLDYQS
ncbi:LysR family transcriptional regulator [Streptococcus moroccensis]|uniref:DNA-binding transcriptional LysR family regulator n=1 Tax=Streptococcus moroccensis TaxID=1451356 RepID=A0ABT9YNX7_9STRE|nr:LysR family transcriptional regulator [Streptococcus moroccensis]MDQ0221684.1 DNA-binding transcriptional LysR family regulator [Streptococcus moroccensis]